MINAVKSPFHFWTNYIFTEFLFSIKVIYMKMVYFVRFLCNVLHLTGIFIVNVICLLISLKKIFLKTATCQAIAPLSVKTTSVSKDPFYPVNCDWRRAPLVEVYTLATPPSSRWPVDPPLITAPPPPDCTEPTHPTPLDTGILARGLPVSAKARSCLELIISVLLYYWWCFSLLLR